MALHLALHNGAPRPPWAGPVHECYRAPASAGWGSVQLAGTVVPLSSGLAPGHRIGFPDLGRHVGGAEGIAAPWTEREWAELERVARGAAVRLMGLAAAPSARMATLLPIPPDALHLEMEGRFAPILGMGHLQGALVRLTRRYDRSGARMRLARTATLSKFRLLPGALSWSRDPRLL